MLIAKIADTRENTFMADQEYLTQLAPS